MAGPGRVLVDSGFFIALFNERDQHHASARRLEEWLDFVPIVLPWPILYETVNTRLARRPQNLAKFGAIVRLPETLLLDDTPYRVGSFAAVLAQNPATGSLSLTSGATKDGQKLRFEKKPGGRSYQAFLGWVTALSANLPSRSKM